MGQRNRFIGTLKAKTTWALATGCHSLFARIPQVAKMLEPQKTLSPELAIFRPQHATPLIIRSGLADLGKKLVVRSFARQLADLPTMHLAAFYK